MQSRGNAEGRVTYGSVLMNIGKYLLLIIIIPPFLNYASLQREGQILLPKGQSRWKYSTQSWNATHAYECPMSPFTLICKTMHVFNTFSIFSLVCLLSVWLLVNLTYLKFLLSSSFQVANLLMLVWVKRCIFYVKDMEIQLVISLMIIYFLANIIFIAHCKYVWIVSFNWAPNLFI